TEQLIKIYGREDGILVFQFTNLGRTAMEQFLDYLKNYDQPMPPVLRILFDLRACGYPSNFSIELHSTVFTLQKFPTDMKAAYLIPTTVNAMIYESFRRRVPSRIAKTRIFTQEELAIGWLLNDEGSPR